MGARPQAEPVNRSALMMMVKIRLLEFTRKPEAVFWTYVFPLLMVGILGSAFRSQPIDSTPIAIIQSAGSQELQKQLSSDSRLAVGVLDQQEAKRQLRAGRVEALVQVATPAGSPDDSSNPQPDIKILMDPARPNSRVAEQAIRLQMLQPPTSLSHLETVAFEEPGSRYVDYLVPGLIGMGLLGGGMWGVGYAIVDMRIRKLLKRFLATPMRRSDFLLAVMISRLFFILPEIAIMIGFAMFFFGFQIYGSWLAVALLILLGGIQFSGVGLLVASRAKTMEAISGLMNMIMLPMWTLSGIFFSYERFPEYFHWPIRLLPLTPLLDALRGVMLEGRSLSELWIELTLMSLWTVITFAVALKIFRWNV